MSKGKRNSGRQPKTWMDDIQYMDIRAAVEVTWDREVEMDHIVSEPDYRNKKKRCITDAAHACKNM